MFVPEIVLPAEWSYQAGVMLTWPHLHSDWRPWLLEVNEVFVELALQISRREALLICCYDVAHCRLVRDLLGLAGVPLERVRFEKAHSNDTWARDHGPITVYRDGEPVLLKFRFNGWGEKFRYELDDQLAVCLHERGAFGTTPLEEVDLVLEGGGIESDGQGTLLVTRRCLLAPSRNLLSQAELERRLADLLGVQRFLWLDHGYLEGDDTDGHIDTLARFCDAATIAYQSCTDVHDVQFGELQAMERELQNFRTAAGEPYRLVPLPLPDARFNADGRRLPAGYANFLIVNAAVLVPTYEDAADAEALARLQDCFPDREVVGVPCAPLIQQYGSLHCVTMQLPHGVELGPALVTAN